MPGSKTVELSVRLGLEIDRRIFAAPIDLKLEVQPVTLIEGRHAGAFDRTDMHEGVRLAIIPLDEAETLHRVEELDGTAGPLSGQLPLRAAFALLAAEAASGTLAATGTLRRRQGIAFDHEIARGHLAATIDQGKLQRLPFGK